MVLFDFILPNGNELIWLGTGDGWQEGVGVDNILITNGGNVLFLTTRESISLRDGDIKSDIRSLNAEEFSEKHDLPMTEDLLRHLKAGLDYGKYPLFSPTSRLDDFENMILRYISRLEDFGNTERNREVVTRIMNECQRILNDLKKSS